MDFGGVVCDFKPVDFEDTVGVLVLERIGKAHGDALLLLILIVIAGIGLSMLFSASTYYAERLFQDPYYFFKRQVLWVILGVVAATIVAHLPLGVLRQSTPFVLAAALILTVLTFVPGIGQPIMGARRWLFLFGQSFEPSELVKIHGCALSGISIQQETGSHK